MKLIRSILIIIITVISTGYFAVAQKNKEYIAQSDKELKEPFFFWGGSLWLGFGTYTYVDVNLMIGTQLNERLSVGVSGKYQYYNQKRSGLNTFETNVYGGSIFSQYAVIKDFRNLFKVKGHSGIIAHVEYEFLNTEYNYVYFNDPDADNERYWLQNVLVGGGYFQQMGKRSKSYIILLWNVNNSVDNPYSYPQLKIGFSVAI